MAIGRARRRRVPHGQVRIVVQIQLGRPPLIVRIADSTVPFCNRAKLLLRTEVQGRLSPKRKILLALVLRYM